MKNVLLEYALNQNEHDKSYVTAEDISEIMQVHDIDVIKTDFIKVVAKQVPLGLEDVALCAFVIIENDDNS